jgi:glycerol kinase
VTNASRTLLMNLARAEWDPELLRVFHVPASVLPKIVGSAEVVGRTRGVGFLPDGLPIAGIAGDQQAALFGQACFGEGDAKCTYGTGAFALVNIGDRPILSEHGLVTTAAWRVQGRTTYALEGSSFVAGAAVQWLRDGLGIIASASEIEELARSVPDSGGVTIVPALTGLGAPHWRAEARGLISGITRGTTRAHIARAALEAIALQNVDLVTAMQADAGRPINSFRVDGGAAANDLLMQIQADLLEAQIFRPEMVESTALGAAKLAALGVGLPPVDKGGETARMRIFNPTMPAETRANLLARWADAVGRA